MKVLECVLLMLRLEPELEGEREHGERLWGEATPEVTHDLTGENGDRPTEYKTNINIRERPTENKQ